MTDEDDGKTVFQPAKKKDIMQLEVGSVLSDVYEIKRFIARGGMGEVYEAVNIHHTEERVAIKVLLPEFAADERVIAMFAKEAGTLTRLHHEAIVPYRLASRDKSGRPYIVTAYVDGPSLEDRFKDFCPTEEEFGLLARRLAEGLGKAHTLGAIHRDIAPDNVLLVDGNPALPKIIDFGIAQDARADHKGATIIGDGFAGKLNYVAPEQLGEYERNIGPWTDLYSLALTLLAVSSQKHADMGGSIASSVKKRMAVPDLSTIPQRYQPAFTAALQPDPAKRPQTMTAFVELLDNAASTMAEESAGFAPLNSDEEQEVSAGALARLDALSVGGKRKVIGVGVGLLLLLSASAAFMLTRTSPDPIKPGPISPKLVEVLLTPDDIARVAILPKCSWLTSENTQDLTASELGATALGFVGGVGDISYSGDALARSLTRRAGQNVRVDLSEVVEFDPKFCGVVEAIKNIKNPQPYISSPELTRTFEVKMQANRWAGDEGAKEAKFATLQVKISNIGSGKSLLLMSIDTNGNMAPLAIGTEEVELLVNLLGGTMKPDGFNTSFPVSLEGTQKEGYGFIVIAGDGEFSREFFGDPQNQETVPLYDGWNEKFSELAKTNNWTSDIFWYSIVDEIDG